ncbi:MAG: aminoglycoside phosphotransferase family protein [Solirubrobacterales bacterium]
MLKDTLDYIIYDYVRKNRLSKELGLGEDYKVDFLAQGEYNINYILRGSEKNLVFRVNTGSQLNLDNQIEYEYEALKRLQQSGVTPEVYYLDASKKDIGYGILIMEYLQGEPLKYDRDLDSAALIFSKIHSIDCSTSDYDNFIKEENIFTERINEANRLLKDFFISPIIPKDLKRFFYKFIEWAEKNRNIEKYFLENKLNVINNTEVNSSNFIIGSGKAWLIDWEKPVISDPCQDLTQFLAPTTTLWKADYKLNLEERKDFFKAYTTYLGMDNNIIEKVDLYNPYLYLRALSWCAYAFLEYNKEDKKIKNMDTYRKINQYLDIDFMKDLLRDYKIGV